MPSSSMNCHSSTVSAGCSAIVLLGMILACFSDYRVRRVLLLAKHRWAPSKFVKLLA